MEIGKLDILGTNTPRELRAPRLPPKNRVETWLFWILVAIVALAPLPLGSNRPLPASLLALAIGILSVAWGVLASFSVLSIRIGIDRIFWPLLLYAAVCFWVLAQWMPWLPASVADPAWHEAARALGNEIPSRISVNPEATAKGLMLLLAYGGIFFLSLQFSRRPDLAHKAIRAIAIVGSIYAIYGILVFLSGNSWVVIYHKWSYWNSLTSTFVNRNSYATYAGLTLICAVAQLLERISPILTSAYPAKIKLIVLIEAVASRAAWLSLSILSITTALLLTASRAGVVSSVVGVVCLIVFYLARYRVSRSQIFMTVAIVAAVVLGIFATSGRHVAERIAIIGTDDGLSGRGDIYELTIEAIKSSPWTGTGLGTFADVFPAYRGVNQSIFVHWDKAHNTYLENALELGLPAAISLNLSIALLALTVARGGLQRKRNKMMPALGIAATLLVGLHAAVDFSLQIPAVAVLYAFIMGVAVSQSWSTRA